MPNSNQENIYHFSQQKKSKDCEIIHCQPYDNYKDFARDPSGVYVLIRVNLDESIIELALCNKDHDIELILTGRKAQDIYHALFTFEKKNKKNWVSNKSHMAYIGKELKKAELALVLGQSSYYQE